MEISSDVVRVTRYPSLVNELLERDPKILERLEGLSKEYIMSKYFMGGKNSHFIFFPI